MVKVFLRFGFLPLLVLSQWVWAANITVQVTRPNVQLEESFDVIFQVEGRIDADPDFRALERDFDILRRSQGSNVQIINGNVRRTQSWNLTLMAKRAGQLAIPAIPFGRDMSPAGRVTVTAGAKGTGNKGSVGQGDLFLDVSITPDNAVIQSQLIYSIKLFRAVNLASASLSEPQFKGSEVISEKLGDDVEYESYRDGVRYLVLERRYLLFPQKSGTLTIEPVTFEGQIVVPSRSAFDIFGQNTRTKRVRSREVNIKVDSIPADVKIKPWLPARSVEVSEEWPQAGDDTSQPPAFRVGEPVTRVVRVRAEGVLASQLPDLNLSQMDGFKLYPDKANVNDLKNADGVIGVRENKLAMIPEQPGSYTLPEIRLSWWNTRTKSIEQAILPARTIEVIGVAPAPARNLRAPVTTTPERSGEVEKLVKVTGGSSSGIWPWTTALFALAWLITTLLYWQGRQVRTALVVDDGQERQQLGLRQLRTALNKSCMANDARETERLLLDWAAIQREHGAPVRNLGQLAHLFDGALREEVLLLNRAIYGAESRPWHGANLWELLRSYRHVQDEVSSTGNQALPALYF